MTPTDGYGKDASGFRRLGTSLEPDGMDLGVDETPIDRFFVCTAGEAPVLDLDAWTLTIDGPAATSPTQLAAADLAALAQVDVHSWIECAGNGRRLFELVDGHQPSSAAVDTQWTQGGMAIARWRGPTLRSIIELAEPADGLQWVGPTGLDVDNPEGEPVRMSLPVDKAMHPDTIVALEMNEAPLPVSHGFPARLIVPGWMGAYSVKWLGSITLSSEWIPSWRADEYYQLRTPDGDALGPATVHPVKSSLTLDWDATLSAGTHLMQGYARSGHGPIRSVEWSVDGGEWHAADLVDLDGEWTWTPFHFEWHAEPGPHVLRSRATDATGATQPERATFHPQTILWNAITPHPVRVDPPET